MVMERKDALTDIVEQVTATDMPPFSPADTNNRQVVNEQGEVITLGQKPPQKISSSNKGVLIELLHYKREIIAAVEEGVKRAFTPYQDKRKDRDGTT
jgi:hypothetical protein